MKPIIILLIALFWAGDGWGRVINVPEDFETIQEAVNNANANDTVLVQPGVYNERVMFPPRVIILASLRLTTGEDQFIARTVLDGTGLNRSVIRVTDVLDAGAVIDGFTVRNGSTDYGGGVYIGAAIILLRHLVVESDSASRGGGGIYVTRGGRAAIENSIIRRNFGTIGGGVVGINGAVVTVTDCLIEENTSIEHGGGIHFTSQCRLTAENIIVRNNTGGMYGGGIHGNITSILRINGGEVSGNQGNEGGGLAIRGGSTLELSNVVVTGNQTATRGGGLNLQGETSAISNCLITGNTAEGEAGGVYQYMGNVTLERCVIGQNAANNAGAVYAQFGRMSIINCTISENTADNNPGVLTYEAKVDFLNTILWNEGEAIGTGPGVNDTLHIFYSDIIGGRDGLRLGEEDFLEWGEGNLAEDPAFVDPEEANWRLMVQSPCIDAGDPESDLDPDSTCADMGVYYVHQTFHLIPLHAGWNIISSVNQPRRPAIPLVWSEIVSRGNLLITKDQDGAFYFPAGGFNNIPPWDVRQGYQAKLAQPDTLVMVNVPVEAGAPIPLREGWSIAAYFPEANLTAPQAFVNVRDYLIAAKDEFGRFYLPEFNFSNMGTLQRGKGYLVKVNQECELVWNGD